jgi:RNA polymerase sigma factor (sigma-70 family)
MISPVYDQNHDQSGSGNVTTPGGLEAAYLANRAVLLRYLRARLGDPAAAEDALQDLWIKLQDLHTGPIAEPMGYLYRMAENLALDRRRAAIRRLNRESDWIREQRDGTLESPLDTASPERIALAREALQRINEALDDLPNRTAYAFRAARYEQTPQKEIAATLGISLRAVEKHLQRACRVVLDLRHIQGTDESPPRRSEADGSNDASQ